MIFSYKKEESTGQDQNGELLKSASTTKSRLLWVSRIFNTKFVSEFEFKFEFVPEFEFNFKFDSNLTSSLSLSSSLSSVPSSKKPKNYERRVQKGVYVPPHRRHQQAPNYAGPVQQAPKNYGEHDDRIDSGNEDGKSAKKRVPRSEATEKWGHDKFLEREHIPKSEEELVNVFGYDIRNEDNAPPRSGKRQREESNEVPKCNETQFSKRRNQRILILKKKGPFGMNIPDILLQKHFLQEHENVSADKALELSKSRFKYTWTKDLIQNTVFENPSQIWKCTVVQDTSGLVSPETEVYVSNRRLQTYQCCRNLNQVNEWSVKDLGMNYAVFGTIISDYHFIDESLDADLVSFTEEDSSDEDSSDEDSSDEDSSDEDSSDEEFI
eukprot:08187.XXX_321838_323235_1 [CDS] Oithona nana genome sequencing.